MASHARRNLARCPKGGKRRFRDQSEAVDALHSESHWVSFRLISQDGNDGQVYERDA